MPKKISAPDAGHAPYNAMAIIAENYLLGQDGKKYLFNNICVMDVYFGFIQQSQF